MVIDQRADHSLRIPRPDLSVTLGTPNACNGCHANQSDAWAAQRVKSWFPAPPPPHFGETLHAAQTDAPGADEQLLNLAGDTRQPVIARATAIELLAARPSPGDLFTLQRLLGDPDAVVRGAAVGWFESVDLPARADVLFPLLSDPARSVRIETGRVLAPLLRQPLPDPIREELANAVREYLEAQAANADRPEAHLNIGLAAVAQGDARSAETAYRTALRLQPDFVPAYANLADLYRMLGDEKASEEVIGQGLQTAPDDAALHHALGLLRVRQGDTVGAVESLTRAAELAPANARYAYVHAVALHSTGNTQEALVALETALERHPGDPDILMSLTTMHRDRGDTESAREYARRLQKVSPDDPAVQALWQELQ